MRKKIFSLLVITIHASLSFATHNRSGYISVRYVSDLTYEATITTFTKASSTQADRDTLILDWGDGTTEKVLRSNGPLGTNGVPNGEILPGGADLKWNIYRSAAHTYPYLADFIVSVTDQQRVSNIININGGASVNIPFHVEAYLKVRVGECSNSTPLLLSPSMMLANVNDTFTFNPTIMDADGDSLGFQLTVPLMGQDFPIPNYQYPNEINPGINNSFLINPVSGELTWITPQQEGIYTVAIRINEYRNGLFFGYSIFDHQIIVINDTLAVPSFNTTWQADSNGNYSFTVNPGNTLQLDFTTIADTLTAYGEAFEVAQPAVFSYGVAPPVLSGSFTWTPDSAAASLTPYITTFRATNYSLPPLETDITVLIYVPGGTRSACTDSIGWWVWPGDANSDGIANNFDILSVGIAYGSSGAARPNMATSWDPLPCADWVDTFSTGVNYKHADCNGGGLVDTNDVSVISLNYGLTHSKNGTPPERAVDPDLFLEFPIDVFSQGDTVSGTIHLGSTAVAVNDIYGIAFSLAYDQNIVDSNGITVEFVDSWLTTQANRVGLAKDVYSVSKVDIGLSRTDHTNASGSGVIANVSFVIQDNIDGKDMLVLPLELQFEDVLAIDKDEAVVNITANGDTVFVEDVTGGVRTIGKKQDVRMYPNPARDEIQVMADAAILEYRIMDITGKVLAKMPSLQEMASYTTSIDVSALEQGSYLIHLTTADHFPVCRKITVFR